LRGIVKKAKMQYNFTKIEAKWQKYWAENQTFKAENDSDKEKFYVLDMFPYPSGAGLHVGHPLGYIASDIYARYKRHKGFNVLHPMGYDSFGLPAEQCAIQTGQHPAITTATNINRYREQLDKIGFSFDWSREVRTSSPNYYKWTQWIFIQLFNSWYNIDTDKLESLITDKTSAIIPVHVYGNICNVREIERIAKKYNLKVIYDAAHTFGVTVDGVGIANFGDASIFSFHATKVFNTIEGGAVTFKNEKLNHLIDQ